MAKRTDSETIEEFLLRLDQPTSRLLQRHPLGPVDFWERLPLTRIGRPLHLEPVADNVSDRNILHFNRPHPNPLSSRLLDFAQIEPLALGDR